MPWDANRTSKIPQELSARSCAENSMQSRRDFARERFHRLARRRRNDHLIAGSLQHRIEAAIFRRTEVGSQIHDWFATSIRVAALPRGPRVGIRAVENRNYRVRTFDRANAIAHDHLEIHLAVDHELRGANLRQDYLRARDCL